LNPISFKRHRFPPDVIRYAVWLYFRFTLSIRDVEDLLAQRGIEVSREAVRCWANKFGPLIAANLRRRRSPPTGRWHLDEMVVKIGGRRMYLWRAVDGEGEVLDVLVQKRRNKHAALKLLRKLLRNQGVHPETITTDKLASHGAAAKVLGLSSRHRPGGMRENNRAENSHLVIRRRERKQQKFKSQGSAQRFLATHAAIYNNFNVQTHLISRPVFRQCRIDASVTWTAATIAA
jgi:putative transposase